MRTYTLEKLGLAQEAIAQARAELDKLAAGLAAVEAGGQPDRRLIDRAEDAIMRMAYAGWNVRKLVASETQERGANGLERRTADDPDNPKAVVMYALVSDECKRLAIARLQELLP